MNASKSKDSFTFLFELCWPILLLISPLTFYLKLNDYGLWHGEILLIFSVVVLLGLFLGLLYSRGWWVFNVLLIPTVVMVSLSFLPEFKSSWFLMGSFFLCLILSIFFLKKMPELLVLMGGCFFLGIVFLPVGEHLNESLREDNPAKITIHENLKPIIHIILDEHEGINGLPTNIEGGEALKNTLSNFYLSNGFTLYANAYSHYPQTFNSIPNFLNFSARPEDRYYFLHNTTEVGMLRDNVYFKALSDKGYVFRVYQADYINYCQVKGVQYASCYTYPSHSLKLLQTLPLTLSQRTAYCTKSYLLQSSLYRQLLTLFDMSNEKLSALGNNEDKLIAWDQDQLSGIAIPSTFEALKKDILTHPQGTVFFAHILLPHSPYMYDENCSPILDPNRWDVNYNPVPPTNTPASRERRYKNYFQQTQCATTFVKNIVDAMKSAGIYDDATIIINGDHGSRILLHSLAPEEKPYLTSQDYVDGYDTLYAVKYPKAKGALDTTKMPIEVLLAKTTETMTGDQINYSPVPISFVYLVSDTPDERGGMMEKVEGKP